MQNNSQTAPVKIYKRSLSGGRDDGATVKNDTKASATKLADPASASFTRTTDRATPTDDSFNRNLLFRRSFSGSKDSRSSSHCLTTDEYNNYSPRSSSHSSEISDKYKSYNSNASDSSAYLLNRKRYDSKDGGMPQTKYYDTLPPRQYVTSPSKDYHTRPPNGCLSPSHGDSPVRRPSQRRISRFLRPDFFDVPQEESCYVKDRKERDLETQNILKRIRERSRERSVDRREKSAEPFCDRSYYSNIDPITMKDRRKSSIPNLRATSVEPSSIGQHHQHVHHVRTKSDNHGCEPVGDNLYMQRRRSLSRSIDPNPSVTAKNVSNGEAIQKNSSFADRILNELQNISIKQIKMCNNDECLTSINGKGKAKDVEKVKRVNVKDDVTANKPQSLDTTTERSKRVSKLIRPKSYPNKDQDTLKKTPLDKIDNMPDRCQEPANDKLLRPKSYPAAKIGLTKELKCDMNADIIAEEDNQKLDGTVRKDTKNDCQLEPVPVDQATSTKKVKASKKTAKPETDNDKDENSAAKPTEKKQKTGFLYSIGQKFEKLRENSKNKVLRKSNNKLSVPATESPPEIVANNAQKSKSNDPDANSQNHSEDKSIERKSRIDAMIRNLRERSVTRGPVLTESGLIQRAVSVEDLSNNTSTFNKCSVNKVLGLFKKFETNSTSVQNTKSSSIIDSLIRNERDRPKSSEYMTKQNVNRKYKRAKSDTIVSCTDFVLMPHPTGNAASTTTATNLDKVNGNSSKIPVKFSNCRDCNDELVDSTHVTKRHSNNGVKQTAEEKERMKNNRKGLVLNFNKLDNGDARHPLSNCTNNNNNASGKSVNYNNNNNNGQITPLNPNGILSPSYDSLTNYSSDSRSIHDDCASTSTFLSPTDEPELYFDDWSICSEDNNFTGGTTTPSPSLSRLSRNSQSSLMGDSNNSSESVIDRIKRRSFYCRFNENKPKRSSNIVGPAAREYYREAAAKLKSRPPDRVSSPPILEPHEYYRQLKQKQSQETKSSAQSAVKSKYDDLKAHHRHSEYLLPKSSLNLPLPTSSSARRISSMDNDCKYTHDYLPSVRSSAYEPSTHLYGTYHPKSKSPSAYKTNGTSCLDSYSTLGRKPRAYEHRSKSLMDSAMCASANSSSYKRGTVDYGSMNRPSIRYRTSSISRSPTNL